MYRRQFFNKRYIDLIVFLFLFIFLIFFFSYLVYLNQGISLNDFQHPLDVDLYTIYENEYKTSLNKTLIISPINPTYFHLILYPKYSCKLFHQFNISPELVIFVKSSLSNFQSRDNIRKSWGNPNCFRYYGIHSRTLFILGRSNSIHWKYSNVEKLVIEEHLKYDDIVQYDFIENYHNVTYKLISTLNFAITQCITTRYLLLIDDDFMMNPSNLYSTLSQITETNYPTYIAGDVLRLPIPVRLFLVNGLSLIQIIHIMYIHHIHLVGLFYSVCLLHNFYLLV
ncbi:unnamed protein product [Heterobilharzia americana]|nr:unnamed protein product [Heterobilharzia americana]